VVAVSFIKFYANKKLARRQALKVWDLGSWLSIRLVDSDYPAQKL
jgi:hypothetical protein